MTEICLSSLSGNNPLGFLCALGTVDALSRRLPGADVRLSWTEGASPRPVISGVASTEQIVDLVDQDRELWTGSTLLNWPDRRAPLTDLKLPRGQERSWVEEVLKRPGPQGLAEQRLLSGLIAEGALDQSGKKTNPTHLDFTAGQQRFLEMARELATSVDAGWFHEALFGSWQSTSPLPVFGWDPEGERSYAYRATDPSADKKQGVPGANWLGFLGLTYFPVYARAGKLLTTSCAPEWKHSHLTWPIWSPSLPPSVVRSLLRDSSITLATERQRRMRGVRQLLRAPIRRTDQGGYGSFGAPALLPGNNPPDGRKGRQATALLVR